MTLKLLRACAILAFSLAATESTLSADNRDQGQPSSSRHRDIVLTHGQDVTLAAQRLTDKGSPQLSRYQRIIVTVNP